MLVLSSCASTFDTSHLTPEYWTYQSYCLGRYQLKIPKNIHAINTDLFYGQDRIRISENENLNSSISLIEDARNEGVDYNEIYVLDKVLDPNKTLFYVTKYGSDWDMDMVKSFGDPYFVTLFHQLDGWLYVIYSSFTISNKDDKLSDMAQKKIKQAENRFKVSYLNRLESRVNNTLPNKSGVCLNGSFLKDNGKTRLTGSNGVYFNDLNIVLTLYMGYPYDRSNLPLLKRDILNSASEFIRTTDFTEYKVIRQGVRHLNNFSGSELLLVLGRGNYYFVWESDDQQVQIELTKRFDSTELTEQQMLQAWDSILPTFKRHH